MPCAKLSVAYVDAAVVIDSEAFVLSEQRRKAPKECPTRRGSMRRRGSKCEQVRVDQDRVKEAPSRQLGHQIDVEFHHALQIQAQPTDAHRKIWALGRAGSHNRCPATPRLPATFQLSLRGLLALAPFLFLVLLILIVFFFLAVLSLIILAFLLRHRLASVASVLAL
eukprot:scaffold123404_cov23-Tisochrysis_lutea.AAC.3